MRTTNLKSIKTQSPEHIRTTRRATRSPTFDGDLGWKYVGQLQHWRSSVFGAMATIYKTEEDKVSKHGTVELPKHDR